MCANNYLGLADHPALIAAAKEALDTHGFGMATGHPWWNRRVVRLSELHQQRLLQLPRSFVVRRTSDAILPKPPGPATNGRGN